MTINAPLAIIGLTHRFPGEIRDPDELWTCIEQGKRAANGEPPAHKFNMDSYYHPDQKHAGSVAVRNGYFFTEDNHLFDAPFFGISKDEADAIDSQQKVVLESVYHALENAGLPIHDVAASKTSVFVGTFGIDHLVQTNHDLDMLLRYKAIGVNSGMIANRVSWFFNLEGTSMVIDTACSSSMVALHLGCEDIRAGNSNMAIITGVNVIDSPAAWLGMSALSFLSPTGRSHSYDSRANGYARAEGIGTIIVKPLADALRDGNTIRAVIRGTGSAQDGKTPGITLPSMEAQARLIRQVYAQAALPMNETDFVEGHGTGTQAGDPIEVEALARAFETTTRPNPLYIGSIKSNIGHTEGAAGIAGIIKSILTLEAGVIPPIAALEHVNPRIKAAKWNISLPTQPIPWPSTSTIGRRRISVNSFGFGGTNAHVILDDAASYLKSQGLEGIHKTRSLTDDVAIPESQAEDTSSHPLVFVISAFDSEGIQRNTAALWKYLKSNSEGDRQYLSDVAYTCSEKRSRFAWNSFVLADSVSDLIENLLGDVSEPVRTADNVANLTFVFNGQGGQWARMGHALMVYPVFRKSIVAASEFLKKLGSPWTLIDEIRNHDGLSDVNEPLLSQPFCTALQVALVELLASWKVLPGKVVGHSSGEIAAAFASGAISDRTAWHLAYLRGVLVHNHMKKAGGMMAAAVPMETLGPYMAKVDSEMSGELCIACFNSPRNHTIAGDVDKIERLRQLLEEDQIVARRLRVKIAYHSAHMRELSDIYLQLMDEAVDYDDGHRLQLDRPVDMFSSLTGKLVTPKQLRNNEYWVGNSASSVRFTQAVTSICSNADGLGTVVEIGPHSTLRSAITEILAAQKTPQSALTYASTVVRNEQSCKSILECAGMLHSVGYGIDLAAVNSAATEVGRAPRMLPSLAPYAFNHANSYRQESRISKNVRLRRFARHDLLGAPVDDWNDAEPRWKNYLRPSEIPWVEDHRISGNIVYPGVGYVIMAIEAMKQIADPAHAVTGFRIRDFSLKAMLVIPEDNKIGIETMVSVRRAKESALATSRYWHEIRIFSYNPSEETGWTEHCSGLISVEYNIATGPIDGGREAAAEQEELSKLRETAAETCRVPVDAKLLYSLFAKAGISFGKTFANLSDVNISSNGLGQVTGRVTIPDIQKIMPKEFLQPHTIHPGTMDSMLHSISVALSDLHGGKIPENAVIPTFIEEAWIAADITNVPGDQFFIHGTAKNMSATKYRTDITAWDSKTGDAKLTITGLEASSIQASSGADASTEAECYKVDWVPDLELNDDLSFILSKDAPGLSEELCQNLQLASLVFIDEALKSLKASPPATEMQDHIHKYIEWMEHTVAQADEGLGRLGAAHGWDSTIYHDAKVRQCLLDSLKVSVEGELLLHMGPQIGNIIRQEVEVLETMFTGDLMDRYYSISFSDSRISGWMNEHLEALGRNSTNLRIIEVGAGTGSITPYFLDALSPAGSDHGKIANYAFTDISAGFFAKARTRFRDWDNIMTFKTLDLENDPVDQGFEVGSYDVVVAYLVLHATVDLEKTLKNARALLKPGGQLIFYEPTQQHLLWQPIVFGLLPGWWLSKEPYRKWTPNISEDMWEKLLVKAGFSLVSTLHDRDNPETKMASLLIARADAPPVSAESMALDVVILGASESAAANLVSVELASEIRRAGFKSCRSISYQNIREVQDVENVLFISLITISGVDLSVITSDEFGHLQYLLTTGKNILWLQSDTIEDPKHAMITGMLRVLRWERHADEVNFATLEIQAATLPTEKVARMCQRLFQQSNISANGEYRLDSGHFFWSRRLLKSTEANRYMHSRSHAPEPVMQPFGADPSRALKLTSATPGLLNQLQFVDDPIYPLPLGDKDVEVRIEASSLNFRDVMVAMDQLPSQRYGIEGAGIVVRVGRAVSKVAVGDRVVGISAHDSNGTIKTFTRFPEFILHKIPDHMTFEQASSIPMVFVTAVYSLQDISNLLPGESVLIHGAAGGTGQAAIQFAKWIGAEIFATVSTPEKKELLMNVYGIPEDHIFSSRDLSFAKGVMRMTKGVGVDVILNSLAGEALHRSWKCLAPHGRFVELGVKDGLSNARLDMNQFTRNAMYAGIDLSKMVESRGHKFLRAFDQVMKLFSENILSTVTPLTLLDFSQLEVGYRLLQSGRGMGKIIFKPHAEDIVPVVPPIAKLHTFPGNVSYVLAGGLGGLGRSIARWMAARGARNFIFICRSVHLPEAATELIKELEEISCRVLVCVCDISKHTEVATAIQKCADSMPPIKGCLQCAMVLRDSAFHNMTFDMYQTAILPKVQGSWNLHDCLPADMDFFIMLASAAGITGNRGQSNYAAGSAFQDALARHRAARGMAAASIDLGPIESVGYVAETVVPKGNLALAQIQVYRSISQEQLHSILEYHFSPFSKVDADGGLQTVLGASDGKSLTRRGVASPPFFKFPMYTHLNESQAVEQGDAAYAAVTSSFPVRNLLLAADSVTGAAEVVTTAIQHKLASMFSIALEEISPSRSLQSYGVDSLVAMEIRGWLAKEMAAEVSTVDIIKSKTIADLSKKIVAHSGLVRKPASD